MKQEVKTQRNLVRGTWALVILSLISVILVCRKTSEQVKEISKATELQWRPFLHVEHSSYRIESKYYMVAQGEEDIQSSAFMQSFPADHTAINRILTGMPETGKIVERPLSEVPLSSHDYQRVGAIGYTLLRTIRYLNTGATPLRITGMIGSSLSEWEWLSKYGKSVEEFVEDIRGYKDFLVHDVDVVIFPDSSFCPSTFKGIGRIMFKDEFEEIVKGRKEFLVYLYTYIAYEDLMEHRYNTLRIETIPVRVDWAKSKGDTVIFRLPEFGTLEKYRWDI